MANTTVRWLIRFLYYELVIFFHCYMFLPHPQPLSTSGEGWNNVYLNLISAGLATFLLSLALLLFAFLFNILITILTTATAIIIFIGIVFRDSTVVRHQKILGAQWNKKKKKNFFYIFIFFFF